MDRALTGAGLATGAGFGLAAVMVAWQVIHSEAMLWFVVVGTMTAIIIMLVIVAFAIYRSSSEARAQALARSNEQSLISARSIRTLDGVQARPVGNDYLGALIAGMPGADVVGGTSAGAGLTWGDEPGGAFGTGEE